MISIITATYNRKHLLPKSLESILRQTYQDFEIIIVDDGSTDDTESFIREKFQNSRIRYIKLPQNKGATFARNIGLEEMKGDYFLVWDSDDILYPNALQSVIDIYKKNPKIAVVSAPARSLLNNKEISYHKIKECIIPREIIICRDLPSNHKVRIAKTSLCGDIRYKAKNIDFLVNVEMAERGDWYCYPEYLADVIIESDINSLTTQRKKTRLELSVIRAPYLYEYVLKYKDLLIKNCPRNYAGFSYGAAIGFFVQGNIERAKELIWEACIAEKKLKYFLMYILTIIPFGLQIFKLMVSLKNKII